MKQHLKEMTIMIREFKIFGHVLTNEEKVEVVIRSLLKKLGTYDGKYDI